MSNSLVMPCLRVFSPVRLTTPPETLPSGACAPASKASILTVDTFSTSRADSTSP